MVSICCIIIISLPIAFRAYHSNPFIAILKPASLDENISNLPKQKISNMFIDHGPIPKTLSKLLFKSSLFKIVKSPKLSFKNSSEISFTVLALLVLKPNFLISSILRFLKYFSSKY